MKKLTNKFILPSTGEIVGTGWLPPRPDLRDYTRESIEVKPIVKKLGLISLKSKAVTTVDLRK
jgi:hypothetical protein